MRVTFRILIYAKLQDFLLMLGKVFSRLFIIPIRLYQITLSSGSKRLKCKSISRPSLIKLFFVYKSARTCSNSISLGNLFSSSLRKFISTLLEFLQLSFRSILFMLEIRLLNITILKSLSEKKHTKNN